MQIDQFANVSGHSQVSGGSVATAASGCVLLSRGFHAVRMMGTIWAAHGLLVEILVCALSGGGLLGGQVLRLGRFFIGVIFVAELRDTVGRADWQIDALAAPVSICKRAIEILGIGWIGVAESIPAFPNPVQVGVMEIEQRVTADRGEIGHVAPDGEVS